MFRFERTEKVPLFSTVTGKDIPAFAAIVLLLDMVRFDVGLCSLRKSNSEKEKNVCVVFECKKMKTSAGLVTFPSPFMSEWEWIKFRAAGFPLN
ncbi:hypothetical protein TNIN_133421 [Trichonephila inaurata madagascariensis]|uniref:Uncharacterized protein n=1 Tax=Trichonephila inaurata madagascariensis TaxID=2747483 RepID=A0A8X7BZF5_9ARAC|nr:hypothetical protein TNIN_133421 [Trichonephila inaurata madagascariensis]